jgi:hypothetical protein
MIHHRRPPSVRAKRRCDLDLYFTKLWDGCCRYLAPEFDREYLGSITDTQDDTVLYKSGQITIRNGGSVLVGDAVVTPGEDDEPGLITARSHGWDIRGINNPTAQTNVAQ